MRRRKPSGSSSLRTLRDAAPALRIETNCGGGSFKSQLKRADRSGARFAVIVGDDEASRRVAALKSLRGDAAQREVGFEELGSELRRAFESATA